VIHANLTRAKLIHARLTRAKLIQVVLADAELTDANLNQATVIDVDLTNATVHGAYFDNYDELAKGATLNGVDFEHARFSSGK